MRWINKRHKKNRKYGHAIVRKFLHDGWNKNLMKYVNTGYDELKGERKMERLLLKEQGYYCCYCMRAISIKNKTTLEHILPRKTKADNHNAICHYLNTACYMKKYVKWADEPPRQRMENPPYPHYCAYENLVASCDGSVWDMSNPDALASTIHNTCNNVRSDQRIVPMFYDPQIERRLVYERDGELTYNEAKFSETINAIKLEHATLKLIRKSWAQIVNNQHIIEDVKRAIDDEQLRQDILGELKLSVADIDFLRRKNIWRLLYEYRWFYDYFKYRKNKIKFLR